MEGMSRKKVLLDMACSKSPMLPTSCLECESRTPNLYNHCKVGEEMSRKDGLIAMVFIVGSFTFICTLYLSLCKVVS